MNKPIKTAEREIRILTERVEIRAAEDGSGEYIEGYALKFNRWSETMGGFFMPKFKERINPKALEKTDFSDVVARFNHDENFPLARTGVEGDIGKLELIVDSVGLKYRFKPTDTSYARDLMVNLRAGVVNKSSFAFSMPDDDQSEEWKYNEQEGIYEREILNIEKLWDVAPVVHPAYPDTVVGTRSKEKVEQLEQLRKKILTHKTNNGLFLLRKKLELIEKI